MKEPMQVRRGKQRDDPLLETAMQIAFSPEISLLDQVKIEAGVLLPVLEALRAELGRERADELVTTALRGWRRKVYLAVGERMPGSLKEKWMALATGGMPRIGSDIDLEWLQQGPEAFDLDVKGCRYADLFRSLGEPELGAVLLCECDDHMAEVGGEEVELTRPKTIMKGGDCCEFRYRVRSGEDS